MNETVYLAGGCFWGVEEYYSRMKGVVKTSVGYANSRVANPSYEEVCAGRGGGVEAVAVTYDPSIISYSALVKALFKVIDVTSVNKQGNDRGVQYRSGLYYQNEAQRQANALELAELQTHHVKTVAVENVPLQNYYLAEAYHQAYLKKNPNGYCHIQLD